MVLFLIWFSLSLKSEANPAPHVSRNISTLLQEIIEPSNSSTNEYFANYVFDAERFFKFRPNGRSCRERHGKNIAVVDPFMVKYLPEHLITTFDGQYWHDAPLFYCYSGKRKEFR